MQVNDLINLKTFCSNPKNSPKGLPLRTAAERKRHVTQTLGLQVVVNPKNGLESVPVLDRVVMLTGHKKSTSRIKEESGFESKDDAKEAYSKAAKALHVDTNTKVLR